MTVADAAAALAVAPARFTRAAAARKRELISRHTAAAPAAAIASVSALGEGCILPSALELPLGAAATVADAAAALASAPAPAPVEIAIVAVQSPKKVSARRRCRLRASPPVTGSSFGDCVGAGGC